MPKKKVLFLHTLPSPYRNPFFEKFFQDKEYDSTVYFMARGAKNRIWKNGKLKFKHKFLPELTLNLKQNDDIIPIWNNPTAPFEVLRGDFDIVVCSGWDSIATFLSRIVCFFKGIPVIVWSGSTVNEKSWRRTVMYWPVKLLVKSCNALISYGKASRDYLISFGVKKEKVFISYNSVDVDLFRQVSQKNKKNKIKMRNKMGIKNKHLAIFVGQFISRKGVLDLYKAMKNVSKKADIGILWVGHGPLEKTLKSLGKKDKLKNQYFAKTHNQEETAKMYSLADFFVLPTHEDLYSNVVPEALAAGLPVITTKENGVSFDYIKEGKNGFVINAKDTKTLEEKILLLTQKKSLRESMSKNTWKLVKNFNYNENVKSFKKAIRYAFNQNSK